MSIHMTAIVVNNTSLKIGGVRDWIKKGNTPEFWYIFEGVVWSAYGLFILGMMVYPCQKISYQVSTKYIRSIRRKNYQLK